METMQFAQHIQAKNRPTDKPAIETYVRMKGP
jgi:hypothetical protein